MPRPEDVAHEAPVYFRVEWIDPHPLGEDYPSDDIILSIEPLGQPRAVFIISRERYKPFQDAVTEAIASQAVYWVMLDGSTMSTLPSRLSDAALDRLLEAIKNRQIAPSPGPE